MVYKSMYSFEYSISFSLVSHFIPFISFNSHIKCTLFTAYSKDSVMRCGEMYRSDATNKE